MIILQIQFENDELFENCCFKFSQDDIYFEKVIFAGENGTGKTLLLEIINTFCGSENKRALKHVNKSIITVQLDDNEIKQIKTTQYEVNKNNIPFFTDGIKNNVLRVRYNNTIEYETNNGKIKQFPYKWNDLSFLKSSLVINSNRNSINMDNVTGPNNSEYGSDDFEDEAENYIRKLFKNDVVKIINTIQQSGAKSIDKKDISFINLERLNAIIKGYIPYFNEFVLKINDDIDYPDVLIKCNFGIVPISFLSSGERELLLRVLFLLTNIKNHSIILVDEPEINLHPVWQKTIIDLYRNIISAYRADKTFQLFIATHSPFLVHNNDRKNEKIFVLKKKDGKFIPVEKPKYVNWTDEKIIAEAFNINYTAKLVNTMKKPVVVITEGKTDVKHIKNAQNKLKISTEIGYFAPSEGQWGDSKLYALLENVSKLPRDNIIIGIFDRDVEKYIREFDLESGYEKFSDEVFAFCIPIPETRKAYDNISIEFYYSDEVIKREKDGRSLYFDNEVDVLFNKSLNKFEFRKLSEKRCKDENKKKILDEEKMCESTTWIHSKTVFANLIEQDEQFSKDVDFSNFTLIFDKIHSIIDNTDLVRNCV